MFWTGERCSISYSCTALQLWSPGWAPQNLLHKCDHLAQCCAATLHEDNPSGTWCKSTSSSLIKGGYSWLVFLGCALKQLHNKHSIWNCSRMAEPVLNASGTKMQQPLFHKCCPQVRAAAFHVSWAALGQEHCTYPHSGTAGPVKHCRTNHNI